MRINQGQAGDSQETEITPEMIEAGMGAYYEHNIEDAGARIVLADVYRAMVCASREARHDAGDDREEVGEAFVDNGGRK